jgi:IclR family transcriptional regulator, KDG regulon repressor
VKAAVKKPSKKKKPRLIQSIHRAADILSVFVSENEPQGLADFTGRLKLPKTTIQGIVQTLFHLNLLERDPRSQKYRLGPLLFQLGMKYATNMDLVNIARGWTERLCFQFMQPVNVGMMVGDRVVVVLRVEPENRFMVFPQTGSVIPAHSTAIGKTLLAYMEEEQRARILDSAPLVALTVNTILDRERLLEELREIREAGIAFDREENFIGLSGIGAPVFNYTGQATAAFVVTGDTARIEAQRQEIIDAVRYTAVTMSSQLGYDLRKGERGGR